MPFQDERNCCQRCISILHASSNVTLTWREGMAAAFDRGFDKKDYLDGIVEVA